MHNRICIFSIPRSGSTYLCDVIRTYVAPITLDMNHSKDGRSFGHEPFLPADTPPESIGSVIDEFNNLSTFAMKMQFNEIEHLFNNRFLDNFKSLNTYNILLLRRDVFEAALSLSVAIAKNEFINFRNFDEIIIDQDMLRYMIDFLLAGYNQLVNNVWNLTYNEIIYYENLVFIPKQDFENTQLYKSSPSVIQDCILDKCKYKAPSKELTVKNYRDLKNIAVNYLSQIKITGIQFEGTCVEIL